MANADFRIMITDFGSPDQAEPLIRAVAEVLDRFGFDHLLCDMNRNGDLAWRNLYQRSPIVICGPGRTPVEEFDGGEDLTQLKEQIMAAGGALLPTAMILVEWDSADSLLAESMARCRTVERLSRTFGYLAGGVVPHRVRWAILEPESYFDEYGKGHPGSDQDDHASRAINALCLALEELGPKLGHGWVSDRVMLRGALRNLEATLGEEALWEDAKVPVSSRGVGRLRTPDELHAEVGIYVADSLVADCVHYFQGVPLIGAGMDPR